MEPTGSIVTIDRFGSELARSSGQFQALSNVADAGNELVLWGAFSNSYLILRRDGQISQHHTLERDGYSGFTALQVHEHRIVALMNDGYGPNGYRMVPVDQGLSGENARRGLVDLYVTSFGVAGNDLILVGSKDDAASMTSTVARYSLADDRVLLERTDVRYSECSMALILQDHLYRACTLAGDPGFERVISSVNVGTLEEERFLTLDRPIRAMAATSDGRLLVASDNQLDVFDQSLSKLSANVPLPADRELSLADFQSSYILDGYWYLMLKAPRVDVGDRNTHVATAVIVDLTTAEVAKTVSIDLDRTGDMSSVVVIPGSWFEAR